MQRLSHFFSRLDENASRAFEELLRTREQYVLLYGVHHDPMMVVIGVYLFVYRLRCHFSELIEIYQKEDMIVSRYSLSSAVGCVTGELYLDLYDSGGEKERDENDQNHSTRQ